MGNIQGITLPNSEDHIFIDGTLWEGHKADWDALSAAEQAKYRYVSFDDDGDGVVDMGDYVWFKVRNHDHTLTNDFIRLVELFPDITDNEYILIYGRAVHFITSTNRVPHNVNGSMTLTFDTTNSNVIYIAGDPEEYPSDPFVVGQTVRISADIFALKLKAIKDIRTA